MAANRNKTDFSTKQCIQGSNIYSNEVLPPQVVTVLPPYSEQSSQTELFPPTGVTQGFTAVTITVICSLLPNYSLDKALCALLNKEGQDGTENETVSD